MPLTSAGVLLFRRTPGLEVFIAHMGGPFWTGGRERAWSIPKGLIEPGESAREAAYREFAEEIGVAAPEGVALELGTVRATSSKVLHVFAIEAPGFQPDALVSARFEIEWPPRSGRIRSYPEVDDAQWVAAASARDLLVKGQVAAIDRLEARLSGPA
ncbi:NUDIX domain-containing protein [Agromyces marinus]|uniref:DNA mismatch repair protein MutT n=1 Tax=Agromyces marinus TaxID=1389020 RepID=A0ABM8GZS5_9MICO|nr:NUDIX domain-containing protein [Agromyces marinus]UIP57836.1 hypothetical protein DSM26151_07020 [Agromyces marinus]BDZ53979.1 DNA mismatch repair protein MutT [Agromyces marinus]